MENNDMAKWINAVLREIRGVAGPGGVAALENCGRRCLAATGMEKAIELIRNCVEDKDDAKQLFDAYKEKIYMNRPNLYREGEDIYLEYDRCGCGMVISGGVSDPYLCNCTIGYTKQIFETLFARPVEVRLMKSILSGDSICKQRITLRAG